MELQVHPQRAAIDAGELRSQLGSEVVEDVAHHARLGGRGEAEEGRDRFVAGELLGEPRNVAVVRTEIVAPFREAVGLIDHPVADLPLLQH